jgi:hypothetical protein
MVISEENYASSLYFIMPTHTWMVHFVRLMRVRDLELEATTIKGSDDDGWCKSSINMIGRFVGKSSCKNWSMQKNWVRLPNRPTYSTEGEAESLELNATEQPVHRSCFSTNNCYFQISGSCQGREGMAQLWFALSQASLLDLTILSPRLLHQAHPRHTRCWSSISLYTPC